MSADPNYNIWRVSYNIRSNEVDKSGKAKPAALLNLFQEAATDHAMALGVGSGSIEGRRVAWVLNRLQVRFPLFPGWRSEVRVETWPSGIDRLFAFRDFLLKDSENRMIGSGISTWLLIDPERRRPIRMPQAVSRIRLPGVPRALRPEGRLCEADDSNTSTSDRLARAGDIDINGHVNNVRYLEWILDEIPVSMRETHRLSDLDIRFKAESVEGDSLRIATTYPASPPDPCTVSSSIQHANADLVAVEANMRWRAD